MCKLLHKIHQCEPYTIVSQSRGRLDASDYLILDVKLLLINMNHIVFFIFRKSIDTKNLKKLFTLVNVAN